jgi:hypothetical protein
MFVTMVLGSNLKRKKMMKVDDTMFTLLRIKTNYISTN